MIGDFLMALRFLTVFPVPAQLEEKERSLAHAMVFFPAVGLLIGALSLALFSLAESIFPPRVAVLFLLVVPVLLSGGLHIDGLADFCDGFFAGKDKADVLRIMKDPSVGVWGVLGITLLLLSKYELLLVLPYRGKFLLLAMAASRWAQVALSFSLPYAGRSGGLGEIVAKKVTFRVLAGATVVPLILACWLRGTGLMVLGGLVIFLVGLAVFFKKKLGGVTGDLLGAASELTELFIFLFVVALYGR